MKGIIVIMFLLVPIMSTGQHQETWPGETSEWYYEIKPFIGCMPCFSQYQHIRIVGDTLIQNKLCKIIEKNSPTPICDDMEKNREFLYDEDQVVYWYNPYIEDFTILYDFKAEKDDTWEIAVRECSFTVHVDSVSSLANGALERKVLHISDERNYFTGTVIEHIGHTRSMFPKDIYYECDEVACDSYFIDGLQCYLENGALIYNNGTGFCDTLVGRQRYYPLLDTNKVWNIYENWIWWSETQPLYLERWEEDTTNFIVKRGWFREYSDELGYLTEDIAGKKVYYINKYRDEIFLLYDFNLVQGDVFNYRSVTKVDSIQLLDGTNRKRIEFEDGYYSDWIEGIGSFYGGLLWSHWHFKKHIPGAYLLCYYENDSLLYTSFYYNHFGDTCNFSFFDNIETIDRSQIPLIYPNPFSQKLSISFDNPVYGEIFEIIVKTLDGREVYKETTHSDISLDLAFLSKGVYLLVVKQKEHQSTTKIVKI